MLEVSNSNYAADGLPYCKDACELQLEICAPFNDIVGGDPLQSFGYSCDSLADTGSCHTGGETQVQEVEPVCPTPLAVPNDKSYDRDAHIEWVPGTACAMPCPNTVRYACVCLSARLYILGGLPLDGLTAFLKTCSIRLILSPSQPLWYRWCCRSSHASRITGVKIGASCT